MNNTPRPDAASNLAESSDESFRSLTQQWILAAIQRDYTFNFRWMGRPEIQLPQDVYAAQELIWACKPDLIIETGIAHGGSLVRNASLLALLDYCDAVENSSTLDPRRSHRKVLGIDIDIRAHNRAAVEAHPMAHKIRMLEGSSVDSVMVEQVRRIAEGYRSIMVFLDSNHTHDHVLRELEAYAPLVTPGSYCVVSDTGIEDLPERYYANRPWDRGNNPKTAVRAYLELLEKEGRTARDGARLAFEIDSKIEREMAITGSPSGFLKRVR